MLILTRLIKYNLKLNLYNHFISVKTSCLKIKIKFESLSFEMKMCRYILGSIGTYFNYVSTLFY